MKTIELHLLQSFPFTCLNRDDVGAPKTAYFGGVQRARVSSQCWKRAIRERAFELAPEYFAGKRGHYHAEKLRDELVKLGFEKEIAQGYARAALEALVGVDKKEGKEGRTKVALYLTPLELSSIAQAIVSMAPSDQNKIDGKIVSKAIKEAKRRDFFDVAAFGRMVADDPSLTLEGAALVSHALSTHEVANEVDFFSAVDDTQPLDAAGAGHIGSLEASSACYYRYVGLNLDLLFGDEAHLKKVDVADRRLALEVFLRAVVEAVPHARKNSMFGFTLPQCATALVRRGQPLSLVNAFEVPVRIERGGGYVQPSCKAMVKHYEELDKTYGVFQGAKKFELGSDKPLDAWINAVVDAALEE